MFHGKFLLRNNEDVPGRDTCRLQQRVRALRQASYAEESKITALMQINQISYVHLYLQYNNINKKRTMYIIWDFIN